MEANCPSCGRKIIIEKREKQTAPIKLIPVQEDRTNHQAIQAEDHFEQKNALIDARNHSLIDSKEDEFVLRSLNGFKLINNIVTWILCIILFVGALTAFMNRRYAVAIPLLIAILPVYYYWLLFNLFLSWLRGIYRNIMWLRVISQSMPVPKVSTETTKQEN